MISTILSDPAASNWLKDSLSNAIKRDPVDALNDAEVLVIALKKRLDSILDTTEHSTTKEL